MTQKSRQFQIRSLLLLVIFAAPFATPARAASIDGAKIPAVQSIIDASGGSWTLVSGVAKLNGATAGGFNYNNIAVLYLNTALYREDNLNRWFRWNGTDWTGSIPDPRVTSADGATIPSAARIVDSDLNVWALFGGALFENGVQTRNNGTVTKAQLLTGLLYSQNTASSWYVWTGTVWASRRGAPVAGRSIQSFGAVCDGVHDDNAVVRTAFAAASNDAFPLIIDCPLALKIGIDIARPIFVDSLTTVKMVGAGKFIVDNIMLPAFVLASSTDLLFINWLIEFDGSFPVSASTDGYNENGVFHSKPGGNASDDFNNRILKSWLEQHRHITFNSVNPNSPGRYNLSAIIYFIGETARVIVDGLTMTVPTNATADRFIPYGVSFKPNFKDGLSVSSTPTVNSVNAGTVYAIPHNIQFLHVTFDGILMGFQGNLYNSTFDTIISLRCADLQDAAGNNVGGVNQNFPPPHLFYLNFAPPDKVTPGDPVLYNRAITINNVRDAIAPNSRVGTARRGGSGYADSLKFGCITPSGNAPCVVNNYQTNRPDGFMDVYYSDGVNLSNIQANIDSSFTYGAWNSGIRFVSIANAAPTSFYKNMNWNNVSVTDTAANSGTVTSHGYPIGPVGDFAQKDSSGAPLNSNLMFTNVTITLQHWAGSCCLVPSAVGLAPGAEIAFVDRSGAPTQYLRP